MTNKILKEILELNTDISDLVRLGSQNDGGYVVNNSSLVDSEVLYTYGVCDDYNFELDYCRRFPEKTCKMFDHTVDYPHEVSNNLFFKKEALEINDDDSQNSFIKHLEEYQDLDKRIFLKLDVESYEYDFFLKLSTNFNILERVTGMAVEFHDLNSLTNYVLFQKIINKLKKYFEVTHVHGNNHAPCHLIDGATYPQVIELSFCNLNLSKEFNTRTANYPIKDLDQPCHPGLPEISLIL